MTNRKIDRQRISRQLHEVTYCRKLAKELINETIYETIGFKEHENRIKRVCKALLKFTKGYTKSPNGRKWKK